MKKANLADIVGIDQNVAEFLRNHAINNVFAVQDSIEILRAPLPTGWTPNSFQLELASDNEYPLDPKALQLLATYRDKLVGLGWETKYRIAVIEHTTTRTPALRVVFVPTTYEEGTGFHHGLVDATTRGDDLALALRERLACQLVRPGRYSAPGVAVVHAIVITADGYVLLCKRSPHVAYSPLHWSLSFEEQINQKDVAFGNAALSAAVIRGFEEELVPDHTISLESARILGIFLGYDTLNISFCAYIETSLSLDEIKSNWNRKAKDKWEAVTVVGEPFTLDNTARLLRSSRYGERIGKQNRFHPTSKYRLLLAAVCRFGSDSVTNAFECL